MERIEADLLIPGRGKPVRNGCVVLDGAEIAFAGPVEDAPKTPKAKTVGVPAVMPGMWDVHGHFLGIRTANFDELPKTSAAVMAARSAKDAEKALQAGFTSIREVGGWGVHLAKVVDEGTIMGPHIYGAGAALSQTGGHGDLHSYPLEAMAAFAKEEALSYLCDGVPECLKGVRVQLRLGAKVIKVLASGGVMSEVDNPMHQQFSDEELRAIVAEAGRSERLVAAHCHGKAGVLAALRAGCGTIEHGTYVDDEAADMMIEKGAILVPTRFVLERLLKHAKEAGVPDYAYQKLLMVEGVHAKNLKRAVKKGVRIALGTDIWMSDSNSANPWGANAYELLHLVNAGMSPLQAIEAATATGPMTLGPQAPKSGQLRVGYDADVLALTKNPLSNIEVLTSPDTITTIWKSGVSVKGLGRAD